MPGDILYLGDTSLTGAAAYLGGLLTRAGWSFDYVPSDVPLNPALLDSPRQLFLISDYPAGRIDEESQRRILSAVAGGSGLLMIGGWESFQGSAGCWQGTPIGERLPVEIETGDDRVNCDQPLFVLPKNPHPVVDGLPWEDRPPLIGGYNRVRTRPGAAVLLEARRFAARASPDAIHLLPAGTAPLLVVENAGDGARSGRVAALMTDLAPHWVGPLVDWGGERVTAQAPGGEAVEVGSLYARFVGQLIAWLLKRPLIDRP